MVPFLTKMKKKDSRHFPSRSTVHVFIGLVEVFICNLKMSFCQCCSQTKTASLSRLQPLEVNETERVRDNSPRMQNSVGTALSHDKILV